MLNKHYDVELYKMGLGHSYKTGVTIEAISEYKSKGYYITVVRSYH